MLRSWLPVVVVLGLLFAAANAVACPDAAARTRMASDLKAGWTRAERYNEDGDFVHFLELPDDPRHCLAIVSLSNGRGKQDGADHHIIELAPEGDDWKRVAVQADAFSAGNTGYGPRPGAVDVVNGHPVLEFRMSTMNRGYGSEWVILVAQIDGSYRKVFEGAVGGMIAGPPTYDETGHITAGYRFVGGAGELPDIELYGTYTQTESDPDDRDQGPTTREIHTSEIYRLIDGEYQRIDCEECKAPSQ